MKVLVTGASGLIGSALVPALARGGHEVLRLVRSRPQGGAGEIMWDPASGEIDASRLEGLDGVVHLAGENIAGGRWTPVRKAAIRDSRVRGTALLAETLSRLERPPKALVSASAIGYYGDRGKEVLTETHGAGSGFLPEVCREWEDAARPAVERGVRVVHPRIGIVLSAKGGALAKMLLPFRMGVGGRIGTGDQYMSWIGLEDLVGVLLHALETEGLAGPVNAVAPQAVTNREFTKTLGRVLRRPTLFPLPAFLARLALGEMADALLLASARVRPAALEGSGYAFQYPKLGKALQRELGG